MRSNVQVDISCLLVSCHISGPVVSMWALLFAVLSNWLVHTALSMLSANLLAYNNNRYNEWLIKDEFQFFFSDNTHSYLEVFIINMFN